MSFERNVVTNTLKQPIITIIGYLPDDQYFMSIQSHLATEIRQRMTGDPRASSIEPIFEWFPNRPAEMRCTVTFDPDGMTYPKKWEDEIKPVFEHAVRKALRLPKKVKFCFAYGRPVD